MKLSDGRKAKMHVTPPCLERERLSSATDRLLAELLESRGEVAQTIKTDPTYGLRLRRVRELEGKFRHAQRAFYEHTFRDHRCW